MLSKTVKIDGKEVTFACSAGTLIRYRMDFDADLLIDMQKLAGDSPDLDVLTKLAYTMAKQGSEEELPPFLEWLDQFDMVKFMAALPEVTTLWVQNNKTHSTVKKK